jgi:oligopeptide transport system substrate-binding protein
MPSSGSSRIGLRRFAAALVALLFLLGVVSVTPWRGVMAAGQPLRYLGGEVKTLDPARISDAGDVQLLLQLYAGLSRLDEQGNVTPSLASSWDISDGGRTYTFHLHSGLRFSDGSPLDATDVRRSWLRLLDPTTAATAPDVLNVIDGAAERLRGGPEAGVGIQAPNATTLVVHLRHAAGYFTAITATPTTFVVPRTATSGDWQSVNRFVGSGPYTASAMNGTTLVLKANPDYAGPRPPIDEVDWLTDVGSDAVTAYSQRQLDLVQVAPTDATWIAYDKELGPGLHQAASLSVRYLGFDTTRKPFDDPRVRRAFTLALDKPRLVEEADGPSANAANSIVPPAIQSAGLPKDAAADPDEARRLLDAAGYADRSKLGTITVNASSVDVSGIVATWRKELGVAINVETMAFSDYLAALDAGRVPQVFTIDWIADYPSPHALYDLLLAPGARSNYGHWDDPTFSSLLDQAASANGEGAQAAAYARVEARIDDQAPLIPWAYDVSSWLVRPGLNGLGSLTVGLLDFGLVSWSS